MSTPQKLSFSCDQKWEDMPVTGCGRFCEQCQKPVIDFTGLPRTDVVSYLKRHPGTCGQYDPEQVDPSLIPIEHVGRNIRNGFLASIAALAFQSAQAQERSPASPTSTEQTVHEPSVNDAVEGTCVRAPQLISAKEKGTKSWIDSKRETKRPKMRVYFTSRFPFVEVRAKRRARLMGF